MSTVDASFPVSSMKCMGVPKWSGTAYESPALLLGQHGETLRFPLPGGQPIIRRQLVEYSVAVPNESNVLGLRPSGQLDELPLPARQPVVLPLHLDSGRALGLGEEPVPIPSVVPVVSIGLDALDEVIVSVVPETCPVSHDQTSAAIIDAIVERFH